MFDFIDGCPLEFGPKENNGCPWPDTDGDGLLDKDDDCPNIVGPKSNNGCPFTDTDGDGVLDKDDDCPTVVGPVSNKGCPEIEKEVEEILQTAFDDLEFESGKSSLKRSLPTQLTKTLVVVIILKSNNVVFLKTFILFFMVKSIYLLISWILR